MVQLVQNLEKRLFMWDEQNEIEVVNLQPFERLILQHAALMLE